MGDVKPDSPANVHQKMIAALKICAAGERAGEEWLVKTQALKPYAALQIRLCPLSQGRAIDGVEIVKNGPVWVEEDVNILMRPPCHFSANAEVFFDKKKIPAERWVAATANALWGVVGAGKGV